MINECVPQFVWRRVCARAPRERRCVADAACVFFRSGAGSGGGVHHPSVSGRSLAGRKWRHSGCLGDTGRWSCASLATESWTVIRYVRLVASAKRKKKNRYISTNWFRKKQKKKQRNKQWINLSLMKVLSSPVGARCLWPYRPLSATRQLHIFHCRRFFHPTDFIFCGLVSPCRWLPRCPHWLLIVRRLLNRLI